MDDAHHVEELEVGVAVADGAAWAGITLNGEAFILDAPTARRMYLQLFAAVQALNGIQAANN